MKTFNEAEWLKFRAEHPTMRFWQALRAYQEVDYIFTRNDGGDFEDTFYVVDN